MSVVNPYKQSSGAYSIASWQVTPDLWNSISGNTTISKFLIKYQDKICLLSQEDSALLYPNIQEPLSQADYEEWGMNSLGDYNIETDKIMLQMENKTIFETGKVLKCMVNKNNFVVNSLNINGEELSLIKINDQILTFNELGEWENTNLEDLLNQSDFDEHGIIDLNLIPTSKWDELGGEFEVLIFTEDTELDKFVVITTDPFIPIEKVSDSNFEILAWTDGDDVPQIEITVPPFRPLDKLDNQFGIIMGEYEQV